MRKKKTPKFKKLRSPVDLIGKTLELPSSAIARDGKTEIIGNREATVDGCRCVVEYSDVRITLNNGCGNITFVGTDLEITSLGCRVAVIRGVIASVEFSI